MKQVIVMKNAKVDSSLRLVVQRELRTLRSAVHPAILGYYGLVQHPNYRQILIEYCEGGALFDLLHNKVDVFLTWAQRLKMLVDTAVAINSLHSRDPPIIHRDLKSLNVLLLYAIVDSTTIPSAKVSDFGGARAIGDRMTRSVGTKGWQAPEVSRGEYSERVDAFSFPMLGYEVVCRTIPFELEVGTNAANLISNGVRPDLTEAVEDDVPDGLLRLITRCWAQVPLDRPTFSEITREMKEIDQGHL